MNKFSDLEFFMDLLKKDEFCPINNFINFQLNQTK